MRLHLLICIFFTSSLAMSESLPEMRERIAHETGINLQNCKFSAICNDLAAFDCNSDLDGPFYIIDTKAKKLEQCCGGCCQSGQGTGTQCSECPPKRWSCKGSQACLDAVAAGNPALCKNEIFPEGKEPPSDYCLLCYAEKVKQLEVCELIKSETLVNSCYLDSVYGTPQYTPAFCEKLHWSKDRIDIFTSCVYLTQKASGKFEEKHCKRMEEIAGSSSEQWTKMCFDQLKIQEVVKKTGATHLLLHHNSNILS